MKKILSAPLSEHTVNNVKYEVVSTFKESKAGDGAEDLVDKMKRLKLSETPCGRICRVAGPENHQGL